MKKLLLFAAIFASMALASCSKSAADYAKEQFELGKEIAEAYENNDTEKAEKLMEQQEKLGDEALKAAEGNPEFLKEYMEEIQKLDKNN